ncbi:TlpA family protein disulfide reductase [Deinococcus radiophilus]|uniref:TlpA family protein disulfide reductase n=1 Tax=Deinococcus radiophilus TaxID=32062 RepID=UPI0036214A2A
MTHPDPAPTPNQPAPAWKRWLPPLLAFGLVAALGTALFSPTSNETAGALVGKPAPDFVLTSLDGADVQLSGLQGRPVVVNFWASWCGPCREEAPLLRELSERQGEGQLAVVGSCSTRKSNKMHGTLSRSIHWPIPTCATRV